MKTYANRLRYALTLRGINQSELARLINVSPQSIQYLCRQGTKSTHTQKIADALNINAQWLDSGEGVMDKNEAQGIIRSQHYVPVIEWHEISRFVSSNNKDKELKTMPVNDKLNGNAFAVKIETNEFAPYILKGQHAIIEPKENTRGRPVLIEYKGVFLFAQHSGFKDEYFIPIDNSLTSERIPYTEAKIIGEVMWRVFYQKG